MNFWQIFALAVSCILVLSVCILIFFFTRCISNVKKVSAKKLEAYKRRVESAENQLKRVMSCKENDEKEFQKKIQSLLDTIGYLEKNCSELEYEVINLNDKLDIALALDGGKNSIEIARNSEMRQQEIRAKRLAKEVERKIYMILSNIEVGDITSYRELERAKAIYNGLDSAAMPYFNKEIVDRLNILLFDAKREIERAKR